MSRLLFLNSSSSTFCPRFGLLARNLSCLVFTCVKEYERHSPLSLILIANYAMYYTTTGCPIYSWTWVELTLIWVFCHLAQLSSRFCQIVINPGRQWNTHNPRKQNPVNEQMGHPVLHVARIILRSTNYVDPPPPHPPPKLLLAQPSPWPSLSSTPTPRQTSSASSSS